VTTAANVDLTLDQGADFGIQIYWTDGANNPFTVLSPMRMDVKSDVGTVVYSFFTDDSAENSINPPNILYNFESGLIQLMMSAEETLALNPGSYSYDLFVTYQDNVITQAVRLKRLIYGQFIVQGRVTASV
jgi:hypothetical protein